VHQVPALTQIAELGGPILVGSVLFAANLTLAEPLMARAERRKPSVGVMAAGAIAVTFTAAYGALRVSAVDAQANAADRATVGVVQANMGLMEKRSSYAEGKERHLALSDELRAKGVDFVVWSETSAMSPVPEERYKSDLQADVARRIGRPAIFGAVLYRNVPDDRRFVMYNTAVSSDASGRIEGRYDKEYLLTFGEYLPFGETFPILYKWSPHSGRFTPGTTLDPLVVDIGGTKHAVTALICYEDILPGFTNKAAAHAKPELLVNMTNDAWFGDTSEPWEHLALAKFRAIEHRRYLVRGTNSGVSAVVDPVGRVVARSGTFRQEAISATIHWMKGWTVYEKVGDFPWWMVSIAIGVAAFLRRPASKAAVRIG
jgi:apolipoprotein N-acyltransferase